MSIIADFAVPGGPTITMCSPAIAETVMSRLISCLSRSWAPPASAPPASPAPPTAVMAPAPPPSQHPAYLHALTDLRHARAFLARPAGAMVKWDEKRAIHEIDEAIREIKSAAIDDGKSLD